MNYPARKTDQRGAALVVAMLVFALATTLVVAMTSEFTLVMKRGSNSFIASQAHAYLRGGEDLARLALIADAEQDAREERPRDDLSELWAQQVAPYALDEGGWLTGSLQDLDARLNINILATAPAGNQPFTASQEQFLRLLLSFEELGLSEQDARQILQAVLDWLDADQDPRDFGAEDDYYFDAVPSYRTGNRPMLSVSELRMVAHVTPEIYQAVAPYLTVWGGGSINIQTASARILRTLNGPGILEPLSEAEGEALIELRGLAGFESKEDFLGSAVIAGLQLSEPLKQGLVERSSYFLYTGQVEVADRVSTLYSVLFREDGKVTPMLRSSGAL
jgi:general secretion pathway protein K